MDSQTSSAQQNMGQSAFFYYNPEPAADHRQHGHFSPHPKSIQDGVSLHQYQQQWMHHAMLYGQMPMMHPHVPSSVPQQKSVMATPRPQQQKPAFLCQQDGQALALDTDCSTLDMNMYPSTPALSMSGSAASSPPSTCGLLATPITGTYMGLENMEGVKEGCQGEVKSEILAGGEFSRCDTPPLTPVFIHPPSVTASQASDLLSVNSCPSLSPSPSPVSHTVVAETKFDFCDPRNLLVDSQNSTHQSSTPEFPLLPTLCSGDDEEHKLVLGGDLSLMKQHDTHLSKAFDITAGSALNGLPNFDTFSDLDSENEFVTDLTRFSTAENVHYVGDKRQRLDLISFDEEEFLSEDSFDDLEDGDQFASPSLLTPPESRRSSEDESAKMKPSKKRSPKKQPKREDSIELDDSEMQMLSDADESSPEGTSAVQDSSVQTSAATSSDGNAASSSNTSAPSTGQATARRGRKQSLTDDPSKTFVCDICSRRFRRQEHLKRHHRSLHTHDKPFECNECGKKFSRSDNLSQHARTHGSGAIVMGVLENGEIPPGPGSPLDNADTGTLGAVLFEAAAAAANSSSSNSGTASERSMSPDPSEDSKPAKKRKRED